MEDPLHRGDRPRSALTPPARPATGPAASADLAPLAPPGLELIETLAWTGPAAGPGSDAEAGFLRLDRHLARMGRAAGRLGWRWDEARIRAALVAALPPAAAPPLRMRVTLDAIGRIRATAAPLAPSRAPWRVILWPERLDPADPWLAVKSNLRPVHDRARAALPPGVDEAILANVSGELCEGTITTLFFDLGQGLCTPPLRAGLLPGILRAEMLATGACREAPLALADRPRARLWVGNSLRGLIPALFLDRAPG